MADRALIIGGVMAAPVLAAAVWFASQSPSVKIVTAEEDLAPLSGVRTAESAEPPSTINPSLFDRDLWYEPPPPPPPEPQPQRRQPEPPPANLRLELVGIVAEPRPGDSGEIVYRAALYDPQSGRLHVAASGESIKQHAIGAVTSDSVTISLGGRTRTLQLERADLSTLPAIPRRDPR
ncbi:MAG: hypothetical protein AAGJ54_06900 [Planctomycetota bacterium]